MSSISHLAPVVVTLSKSLYSHCFSIPSWNLSLAWSSNKGSNIKVGLGGGGGGCDHNSGSLTPLSIVLPCVRMYVHVWQEGGEG